MKNWKSNFIKAYRYVSMPYRRVQWTNMAERGSVPVIILFYHRVANEHLNNWTITHQDFGNQIAWFQEKFDIVSLQEAQRRIASKSNFRPTLSITFDDGYAENCEFAIPLLLARNIPVTYFVTTDHTLNQKPFGHDVALGTPLPTNNLESLLAMDAAGIEIGAHTRTHPNLGKIQDDRVLIDEVITATMEMEKKLGRKLRYFAFPFGQKSNLNDKVFAVLKEFGLLGVCSAYGGWNKVGDDPFHLQRLHGDPDIERIKNWLSYDPRIGDVRRHTPDEVDFDRQLLEQTIRDNQQRLDLEFDNSDQQQQIETTTPAAPIQFNQ